MKTYKGYTYEKSNITTTIRRQCFGKYYDSIEYCYFIDGKIKLITSEKEVKNFINMRIDY